MGALPEDVELFIDQRFDGDDVGVVREWVNIAELTTPRVIRSVLYLSNGSLSLLRHYIGECIESVASILVEAEYTLDVSEQPLLARDMSLPFQHRRNLGRYCFGENPEPTVQITRRPPRLGSNTGSVGNERRKGHYLSGQRFHLGEVMYVIARHQPSADLICCYRVDGASMTPVKLPLMFVLERFAENIELTAGP